MRAVGMAVFLAACSGFQQVTVQDLSSPEDSSVDLGGQHLPLPTQLALGAQHSCALLADSTVACWGDNGAGQLGLGTAGGGSFSPVRVPGLDHVLVISALGGSHTCAYLDDRSVLCWGDNTYSQIGGGQNVPAPAPVPGLGGVDGVFAGPRDTCVVSGGSLSCWGDDTSAQAGDGNKGGLVPAPAKVMGAGFPVDVVGMGGELDAFHTCVIAGGGVNCWGSDNFGELGDNAAAAPVATTPVAAGALTGVTGISLGVFHSCAVGDPNAQLYCWGWAVDGELGDGLTSHPSPWPVTGKTGITQVVTGAYHTCALEAGETISCWGRNSEGQLGMGDMVVRDTPKPVPLTGVIGIAAGSLHTCALTVGRDVYCWGWNRNGQLGDGSVTDQATPGKIAWP